MTQKKKDPKNPYNPLHKKQSYSATTTSAYLTQFAVYSIILFLITIATPPSIIAYPLPLGHYPFHFHPIFMFKYSQIFLFCKTQGESSFVIFLHCWSRKSYINYSPLHDDMTLFCFELTPLLYVAPNIERGGELMSSILV